MSVEERFQTGRRFPLGYIMPCCAQSTELHFMAGGSDRGHAT